MVRTAVSGALAAAMFSHVFLGTCDFERALAFYRPLMAVLSLSGRFRDPDGNKLCVVCHAPAATPDPP